MESLCVDFVWRGVVWTSAKDARVLLHHSLIRSWQREGRLKETCCRPLPVSARRAHHGSSRSRCQVFLTRPTCIGFSLASLSVHAGARSVALLTLVLTALSICSVSQTIAVVTCLDDEVRQLVLGGTRRRHFNDDLRPLWAWWLTVPFTMLPSKRCSPRVTCPWLCIWRRFDDAPNSCVR